MSGLALPADDVLAGLDAGRSAVTGTVLAAVTRSEADVWTGPSTAWSAAAAEVQHTSPLVDEDARLMPQATLASHPANAELMSC